LNIPLEMYTQLPPRAKAFSVTPLRISYKERLSHGKGLGPSRELRLTRTGQRRNLMASKFPSATAASLVEELEERGVGNALAVRVAKGHHSLDVVLLHVRTDISEQCSQFLLQGPTCHQGQLVQKVSLGEWEYLRDEAIRIGVRGADDILLHATEECIAVVVVVVLLEHVAEGLRRTGLVSLAAEVLQSCLGLKISPLFLLFDTLFPRSFARLKLISTLWKLEDEAFFQHTTATGLRFAGEEVDLSVLWTGASSRQLHTQTQPHPYAHTHTYTHSLSFSLSLLLSLEPSCLPCTLATSLVMLAEQVSAAERPLRRSTSKPSVSGGRPAWPRPWTWIGAPEGARASTPVERVQSAAFCRECFGGALA